MDMLEKIKIREVLESDFDALVSLEVQFHEYFRDECGCSDVVVDIDSIKEDVLSNKLGADRIVSTFVAELNENIIGTISYYIGRSAETPSYRIYHLSGMLVDKNYRGKKIADMLFEAVKNEAKKNNIKLIKWFVYVDNKSAESFYRRIGGIFDIEERPMYLKI